MTSYANLTVVLCLCFAGAALGYIFRDGGCYSNGAGKCYMLVAGKTWDDAYSNCNTLGGTMAVINNKAQNDAMTDFLFAMWRKKMLPPSGHSLFTGGMREKIGDCSSKFVWRTGPKAEAPLTFTGWAPGEPDCQPNKASCLLADIGASLTWLDGDCNNGQGGVCEK